MRNVLCFTVAAVLAVPLQAETLGEAVALAYRTNPTIQGSRYDVRAADEDVIQARAELRPTLDAEIEGQYAYTVAGRERRLQTPFSPRTSDSNAARAQATLIQPLYTGGRATADRRIAQAGVAASREALRRTEGDLLLGVITAYVDVRRYRAELEVWRTSVSELAKLTDEVIARRQAGELTMTDIAQAQRQVALAREQAVRTEQALEAARSDYAVLVGRDPGELAPEPPLPQVPLDPSIAFDLAERRSPELAQSRFAELGSRGTIAAAKSQGMPTVSLRGTASLSGEAQPYYLRDQNQDYVGSVVLSLPLSAGGRIASQVRQAENRNAGDRVRIEDTRRVLVRNVNNAWNQVVTAGRAAELLDEQRRAAVVQLEGSTAEYRVGLRTTFDVLFAQQTLRDAEVGLIGSRRDRYVAEAALLRQTGLLEVGAIMTGVELHDPADHLRRVDDDPVVPWVGLITLIDSAGVPVVRQRPIVQPPVAPAPAMVVPKTGVSSDALLGRTLPTTPAPGTVGSPAVAAAKRGR